MRYRTLVFDLDGTISDPLVGISRSINHALQALRFPPVDPEQVRPMIGPPLNEIFRHLLGATSAPVMAELIDRYRERYAERGYAENQVYDGMPGIIRNLASAGYTLGICTSKRADYAAKIIDLFGLADCFSFISGGDIGVEKTQQLAALVADGLDAATAVMIGDRDIDVIAGRSNALAATGVLWGFGDREELDRALPNHLLETPSDLIALFAPGT